MSKRLKNYPDPVEVIHQYGADAIRLYMLHSPAVKGDDLSFSKVGVELVLRQIIHSFLECLYLLSSPMPAFMIGNRQPVPKNSIKLRSINGCCLLLNKLIHEVEVGMDDYDLARAVEPFVGFIDQLTNWYIRRSRRRFWEEKRLSDRDQAFATLYYVLMELIKIAAPYIPFISEAIYQNLRTPEMPESVHLMRFSSLIKRDAEDEELEAEMEAVQMTVSLGHALRKEHKLKVRQPLPPLI